MGDDWAVLPPLPIPDAETWRSLPGWRWTLAGGVFAIGMAAMIAVVLAASGAGPFGGSEGRHALTGTVTVLHQTTTGSLEAGSSCAARSGFGDVRAGAPVVISDQKRVVATGTLSAGTARNVSRRGSFVVYDCIFGFRVTPLPTARSYAMRLGSYGGAAFGASQLAAEHWSVALRVISSSVPGGSPQLRTLSSST